VAGPQGRQPADVFYPLGHPTPYTYDSMFCPEINGIQKFVVVPLSHSPTGSVVIHHRPNWPQKQNISKPKKTKLFKWASQGLLQDKSVLRLNCKISGERRLNMQVHHQ
jgi:hypothetical protein